MSKRQNLNTLARGLLLLPRVKARMLSQYMQDIQSKANGVVGSGSDAIPEIAPVPTLVFEVTTNPELTQLLDLEEKKPTFLKKMSELMVDRGK